MPAKKKVVWKKTDSGIVQEKVRHPRNYKPDAELSEDKRELYTQHLVPGSLWRVASLHLNPEASNPSIEDHVHPYANGLDWMPWGSPIVHNRGELAIYLGTTRVEEVSRDKKVSVLRHTFAIGARVYITRNLMDWEPVV